MTRPNYSARRLFNHLLTAHNTSNTSIATDNTDL
jgi:hypothetical protein